MPHFTMPKYAVRKQPLTLLTNAALLDSKDWEQWEVTYPSNAAVGRNTLHSSPQSDDWAEIDTGIWTDFRELEKFQEACRICEYLDRDYQ